MGTAVASVQLSAAFCLHMGSDEQTAWIVGSSVVPMQLETLLVATQLLALPGCGDQAAISASSGPRCTAKGDTASGRGGDSSHAGDASPGSCASGTCKRALRREELRRPLARAWSRIAVSRRLPWRAPACPERVAGRW